MRGSGEGAVIVLDAGVMIALLEVQDAHHSWAVSLLRAMPLAQLTVNALTLAESLVSAAGRDEGRAAQGALVGLGVKVTELTASDALPLAELRAQTSLRMPDTTVLHGAIVAGAQLATTDARLARIAGERGVMVHCP